MLDVEVTPFTLIPNEFRLLEVVALLIRLLVATTPFTVVVKVLPERD